MVNTTNLKDVNDKMDNERLAGQLIVLVKSNALHKTIEGWLNDFERTIRRDCVKGDD